MKWWKCETCDRSRQSPCYMAADGSSDTPGRCPWWGEARWRLCGPAPHEPTCKPTLQVEDDPLPHEPVKRDGTIIGSPEATKILRDTVKKWEASEEGRDHMRRIKARFGLT